MEDQCETRMMEQTYCLKLPSALDSEFNSLLNDNTFLHRVGFGKFNLDDK